MNVKRQQWYQAANQRRAVAGLLCGLFLFVLALAQFETLHRLLHSDAGKATHQCAVTMLQGGQVDAPGACAEVVSSAPAGDICLLPQNDFVASVAYSLPPSCGPPALLA